jgi:hypothetical protein
MFWLLSPLARKFGHTGRSEEWPNATIFDEIVLPWIKTRRAPDTQISRAQAANRE